MRAIKYSNIASTYARHRKPSASAISELCRFSNSSSDSRVLEVGCGNGSHLTTLVKAIGCHGWGIDPSRDMLNHADLVSEITLSRGTGEKIPFQKGFFDLVFSVNAVHHMTNTMIYFFEAFRVSKPGGRICTATDSERIIRNRKPLAQYWPGTITADLKRYASIEVLRQQMDNVGFTHIEEHDSCEAYQITDSGPYKEKSFSCLHLISEEEFSDGLRRLEIDLKRGPVLGVSEFVYLWGRRPR